MLLEHNKPIYEEVNDSLKQDKTTILVHGTGMGKSFIFFELCKNYFKYAHILFIIPKLEIENNLAKYKNYMTLDVDITFKSYNWFSEVRDLRKYDLVVFDEVHHIGSDIYGKNALASFKTSHKILGMTATPLREDKQNVCDYFDTTVSGIDIIDAFRMGLIPKIEYVIANNSTMRLYSMKYKVDFNSSEDFLRYNLQKYESKHRWLCYFSNEKQLEENYDLVKRLFPGFKLFKITTKTNVSVSDIPNDDSKVIVLSIGKLIEGMHLPNFNAVLLFRNVGSFPVFKQILGRLSSITESSESTLFFDVTNTGYKLLKKLLSVNHGNNHGKNKKSLNNLKSSDIVNVSLDNIELFDLSILLSEYNNIDNVVFYKGVYYRSFREACEKLGISYAAARNYKFKNKCSLEAVLDYHLSEDYKLKNISFEYKGVYYDNLKEACEKLGISYDAARKYRFKYKCSPQETLDHHLSEDYKPRDSKPRDSKPRSFDYRGVCYNNLKEACEKLGVNHHNADAYIYRNKCSPQEALDYYLIKNYKLIKLSFEYKGVRYNNLKEACEKLGIIYNNARGYIYRHKCSPQETLDHHLSEDYKSKNISFEYRGVCYENFSDACRKLGVIYNNANAYMHGHKCSPQETLDHHLSKDYKLIKLSFEYKGVRYDNLKDACRKLGINYDRTSSYKYKHKCSKEEALDYCLSGIKRNTFYYKGVRYDNLKDACRKLGINYDKISSYKLKHKCSKEEALDYCLSGIKRNTFYYKGVRYDNLKDACRKLGIIYNTTRGYIRKHKCSNEEALDYYLAKYNNLTNNKEE